VVIVETDKKTKREKIKNNSYQDRGGSKLKKPHSNKKGESKTLGWGNYQEKTSTNKQKDVKQQRSTRKGTTTKKKRSSQGGEKIESSLEQGKDYKPKKGGQQSNKTRHNNTQPVGKKGYNTKNTRDVN